MTERSRSRWIDRALKTYGILVYAFLFLPILVVVVFSFNSGRHVAELTGFYRNYDSLRWVGKRLVLRLKHEPTDAEVTALNADFGALLAEGEIERRGPLTAEREDDDQLELPRLVLRLNQFRVGELHRLIRAVNALDSAPRAANPPTA